MEGTLIHYRDTELRFVLQAQSDDIPEIIRELSLSRWSENNQPSDADNSLLRKYASTKVVFNATRESGDPFDLIIAATDDNEWFIFLVIMPLPRSVAAWPKLIEEGFGI